MTVTEIIPIDSRRGKVYIDDEYAFFLYNSELRRYGIEEGMQISESVLEEIKNVVIPSRVKARTLYILKSSQKTEKQLYDKLTEGGYTREYAAIGVEYARSFGYVDDLHYAQCYVDSACKVRSRRDIEKRLLERGIDKSIICQVLEENRPDEESAIWDALRRKSVTRENIGELEQNRKVKLYGYLSRKGFSGALIRRVLKVTE